MVKGNWFWLIIILVQNHRCCDANLSNVNRIVNTRATCTRDLLRIQFEMDRSFRGVIFAKEFQDECRARGKFGRNKCAFEIYIKKKKQKM